MTSGTQSPRPGPSEPYATGVTGMEEEEVTTSDGGSPRQPQQPQQHEFSPQDLRSRRLEALGQSVLPRPGPSQAASPADIIANAHEEGPRISSSMLKKPPPAEVPPTQMMPPPPPPQQQHMFQQPSALKAPPTSPSTPRARSKSSGHHVTIQTPPVVYVGDDDENDAELQAALAMSLAVDTKVPNVPNDGESRAGITQPSSFGNISESNGSRSSLFEDFKAADNEDDELKAALRLSLQDLGGKSMNEKEESSSGAAAASLQMVSDSAPSMVDDDRKMSAAAHAHPVAISDSPGTDWYRSARPTDALSFHSLMWDTITTTENDKIRWLGQGINFRNNDESVGKLEQPTENDSLLAAVISNFGSWGLTQAHGGPCGVLAAIQAEFLRILLFGPRHIDGMLDYPIMLTNDLQVRAKPDMSDRLMQQGLAMSIAIILARSALVPPADAKMAEESKPRDESARIVLPSQFLEWHQTKTESATASPDMLSESMPEIALSWDSFEPWFARSGSDSGSSKSTRLNTYTISSNSNASGPFAGPKRQKTHGNMSSMSIDQRVVQLAHSISSFLLYPPAPGRPTPLDAFRQPGGVVLLVMSLVNSRGPKLIQSDMDDPIGAKLTSQFGHCSQELINLLLTGQAVSNVFDNTLTPSGELTCKGIQSKPAIGYLSQLEAMRYLEVGGYYKTPRFPIWVVGSSSHFTVMFGDASCLNESQSDILLERCRRAFKAIEGGEENGFIATHHLGKFLKSLDLEYPDHNVQTLAAMIEVHGAGIILWDDLWKHTSRLLMGASFETVLQLSDAMDPSESLEPLPLLLPSSAPDNSIMNQAPSSVPTAASLVSSVPPTVAPYSSDEVMAKRLDAELNANDTLIGESILDSSTQPAAAAAAAASAQPATVAAAASASSQPMSDEEYARKLQAEWDAEAELPGGALSNVGGEGGGGGGSIGAVRGSPTPANWKGNSDDMSVSTVTTNLSNFDGFNDKDDKMIGPKHPVQTSNLETYGKTFQLYHYNGLRGGALKPFRVTRLTPEETVGASISLVGNSNSASTGHHDLEDVVRTKWPSSMINWLGGAPPSID